MGKKQEKISLLSKCIFSLEARHGHLKWKVTDLESKSGVSRSLIYRYLGSTKSEIFENAFGVFIEDFYGFDGSRDVEKFEKKFKEAQSLMKKYSDAIIFYQKWRGSDAPLSDTFSKIELKFQKKLSKLFPSVSQENIPILHAFIHGLVTAPFLDSNQAVDGLQVLKDLGFVEKKISYTDPV